VSFRNKLIFFSEELLAPRPTPKLKEHPLSAVPTAYSIYSQLPSISRVTMGGPENGVLHSGFLGLVHHLLTSNLKGRNHEVCGYFRPQAKGWEALLVSVRYGELISLTDQMSSNALTGLLIDIKSFY
jgi:hypothetical protein